MRFFCKGIDFIRKLIIIVLLSIIILLLLFTRLGFKYRRVFTGASACLPVESVDIAVLTVLS